MTRLPYAGARLDTEGVVALELVIELRERGANLQRRAAGRRGRAIMAVVTAWRTAPGESW